MLCRASLRAAYTPCSRAVFSRELESLLHREEDAIVGDLSDLTSARDSGRGWVLVAPWVICTLFSVFPWKAGNGNRCEKTGDRAAG